ncbi:MAG: aspartate-semialdehyde dehydrogenase [Clostridia bacterium]|nr:aspartate-semialdehyde dehydrogenase [Clostridia bacterium]
MNKVNIAIVGATGMVGTTFIKVLEERQFPIENIYFFASAKSKGQKISFMGAEYEIEELTESVFDRDIDIALFSAGGDISKKFAPIAKAKGVVVVDNSSFWRMDPDVPLVVPEVNASDVYNHNGIIANPNCSTIQCVVPLKVLDDAYKIKRIVYSTYQAVSGSGMKGIRDLEQGLLGNPPTNYPHPIANNCLPHIDVFMTGGYTKEEMKMIDETRKILGNPTLKVTATAVRVPVMNAHSVSINVEFENAFDLDDAIDMLSKSPGIIVMNDSPANDYPMPLNVSGTDEVYVGRIRRDESLDHGLNLWVVADNIRKGAATNTVQIAELLLQSR